MLKPPPKCIAVDVDGTLLVRGGANVALIDYLRERKAEGFSLTLWSSRGEAHARNAAEVFKCADLFDHILSKPGWVIDDKGWGWIKFTGVITRFSDMPNAD